MQTKTRSCTELLRNYLDKTSIMANGELPILYIKPGCSWCQQATEFLMEHGIEYQEKNVVVNSQAFEEMQRISGQTKAPTLDWYGKILSDFGAEELKAFLLQQNVELEDS